MRIYRKSAQSRPGLPIANSRALLALAICRYGGFSEESPHHSEARFRLSASATLKT
jgi:hypothetical protein